MTRGRPGDPSYHDKRADKLEALSEFSLWLGAIPYHWGRGSTPSATRDAYRVALAVPLIQAGLAMTPDEPQLHCALGLSLMEEEPEAARDAFDAALRLDPKVLEALVNRAVVAFDQGRFDVAVEDLGRALDVAPGNPDVLYNRGYAYEAAGFLAEAAADYRTGLNFAGADHNALFDGLARCESALGLGEDLNK